MVYGLFGPPNWLDKGKAHFKKSEFNEANQAFDKAIKCNPNDAQVWNNKGLALYHLDKCDEAIKAYDEAIRLDPTDTKVLDNKGSALRHQGKNDEAIQTYDKAIQLDPESANNWIKKSNILKAQGKYEEAQQAFDKAVEIDPRLASRTNKNRPWHQDDTKMTYVANYNSAEKATNEANTAARYGWIAQGTSATDGHINIGRTAAGVALFGGLALLAGGSRSKGKVTITYVRTPQWLKEHNIGAKKPEMPDAVDSIDIIMRLERLSKLKDQGILSEEEFQIQKKKVLGP